MPRMAFCHNFENHSDIPHLSHLGCFDITCRILVKSFLESFYLIDKRWRMRRGGRRFRKNTKMSDGNDTTQIKNIQWSIGGKNLLDTKLTQIWFWSKMNILIQKAFKALIAITPNRKLIPHDFLSFCQKEYWILVHHCFTDFLIFGPRKQKRQEKHMFYYFHIIVFNLNYVLYFSNIKKDLKQ